MPAFSPIRAGRPSAEDQARLDRAPLAELPGLVMRLNRSGRYPVPLDAVAITAMRMRTERRNASFAPMQGGASGSSAGLPDSSELLRVRR